MMVRSTVESLRPSTSRDWMRLDASCLLAVKTACSAEKARVWLRMVRSLWRGISVCGRSAMFCSIAVSCSSHPLTVSAYEFDSDILLLLSWGFSAPVNGAIIDADCYLL